MNGDLVRVLLVDDDEDDYVITRDLLSPVSRCSYRLDWVDSYESGLEILNRQEHDVYLIDYRLGKRTGLELLRETHRSNSRAPMILLTGQGDHEVDLEAMKAGAADYLVKGQLSSDTLERAIRYAIGHKRAEENLRRERDLISRIMATSPVGVIMTDCVGKITFANARAEQVLGLSGEDGNAAAGNVRNWRFIDPDGNPLPVESAPMAQLLESGQATQDARYAIERADGRRVMLSINATPVFNDAGKVDGLVAAVEDITERLSLEAQLRQSQKMESLGCLAAGVAHDINNILTVIMGHARLLVMAAPPECATTKPLQQISAAAERAANFIKQLLMFSRKQVIEPKVLDLNAVLHNLENLLPRLLREDITLEAHYASDVPHVAADNGMIEQVVMNLAVNARDAMPKGGRLQIATSVVDITGSYARQHPDARPGRFVCLLVADTGCGMGPKTLVRIFEPFFSTKEVGKGTGLGLATVYGIVKQHRGWIDVESKVGVGSVFKIYIPPATKPAEAHSRTTAEPEAVCGGEETVLLVEDQTEVRALVKEVLCKYGYRVLEASSGAEALRVRGKYVGEIDLLLTDLVMPGGMDGYELARQMCKLQSGLKVLYTSGYSAGVAGGEFAEHKNRFLPKPYLPSRLAQMVRQSLDAAPECEPEFAAG